MWCAVFWEIGMKVRMLCLVPCVSYWGLEHRRAKGNPAQSTTGEWKGRVQMSKLVWNWLRNNSSRTRPMHIYQVDYIGLFLINPVVVNRYSLEWMYFTVDFIYPTTEAALKIKIKCLEWCTTTRVRNEQQSSDLWKFHITW